MDPWGFGIRFKAPGLLAQVGRGQLSQLPLHRDEGLEIIFLEHGHLQWVVEGQKVEMPSESVFYTFPWEMHGSAQEYEPGHLWHFVVLRGDSPANKKSPKTLPSFQQLGFNQARCAEMMRILQSSKRRSWPATPRLAMTIKDLVDEAKDQSAWSEETIVTLCRLLLVELTRIVSAGTEVAPTPVHFTQRIQGVLQEIRAHPERKWTLTSMAAAAGLHRTHFTNAVKHETGDTPLFYLRRMRIDKARTMLQTTEATITEIAFACGFESSQHFARLFREFTGQPASDYRKISRRA